VLARSFRLSRDKWKQKHHVVQAELEQARQLAAERGAARDQWRERCEQAEAQAAAAEARAAAAEAQAAERLQALEHRAARSAEQEAAAKKNAEQRLSSRGR